ncbi:MAG: aspartate/glutamate racemase family protein [Armatimonadetes bacterium]|nr:aspartate/glutamate racemase family protein [Armatimonadota bacterium]
MYGWRAKIGLIIPANNTVIEPELWHLVPDGVSVHATRLIVEGPFTPEALDRMQRGTARAVEELVQSEVGVIVYACMSTSLAKGRAWDDALPEGVLGGRDIRMFSAASATMEALRHLGVRRPAVISPYPAAIHPLIGPFFAAHGLEVTAGRHMEIADYHAVVRVRPQEVYRFARSSDMGDADGICILATDLRTVEIIEALEHDTGLPVVTTNQAILWKALASAGITGWLDGVGRLFRSHPRQANRGDP